MKATPMLCFWVAVFMFNENSELASQPFCLPNKAAGISFETYDYNIKYLRHLNFVIDSNAVDDPEYGFVHTNAVAAYCRLKAPADTVFRYLQLAIDKNPGFACERTYLNPKQAKFNQTFLTGIDRCLWDYVCQQCGRLYATYDSTLIKTLDSLSYDDQHLREALDEFGNDQFDPHNMVAQEMWKKQRVLDSLNLIRVENLIVQYGYIGREKVGVFHEEAMFLIIQHAPVAFQEKYLWLINKAANEKQLSLAAPAYLLDRIKMHKGEKQVYGTQFKFNEKEKELQLYPVENLKAVDRLRKSVGLGSLADYMKYSKVGKIYHD